MCGIAGALLLGESSFKITEGYIVAMRDRMVHRGPDGAGVWVSEDKKIGLGHRRLSIIDLSDAASQPMSNSDNTLWITYNGEIYNHAEIRTELTKLGHSQWKTDHSDTVRGMFAFGIWDTKKRELWLVRDRIGIKPLYYSIHDNRIVFASEIKAILKDPDQKRSLNEQAFYHYLSFAIPPAPDTLFQGIHKLPAGSWLKVSSNGEIQSRQYWDVLDHTIDLGSAGEDEIAKMLLTELRTAVSYRKVSDVPVGVFLSGGIDSSTNAVLFSEGEKEPVKTFTIGYKGEYESYQNETGYAKMMAEILGAQHHERLLTVDDFLCFMPEMVHLQDEPIADPVCFPVYFVSKLAHDNGVIVCQVGEGADELFWGYEQWKTLLKLQQWDDLPVPRFVKSAALGALGMGNLHRTMKYEWVRRGLSGSPIFWSGADIFPDAEK
ncbi:MAG: asparagine synthase (glutamine-hydrolyzing), partial [bacterium]|nr:asparagine synthase (glutamine-hydrolyzing) [bacterium]